MRHCPLRWLPCLIIVSSALVGANRLPAADIPPGTYLIEKTIRNTTDHSQVGQIILLEGPRIVRSESSPLFDDYQWQYDRGQSFSVWFTRLRFGFNGATPREVAVGADAKVSVLLEGDSADIHAWSWVDGNGKRVAVPLPSLTGEVQPVPARAQTASSPPGGAASAAIGRIQATPISFYWTFTNDTQNAFELRDIEFTVRPRSGTGSGQDVRALHPFADLFAGATTLGGGAVLLPPQGGVIYLVQSDAGAEPEVDLIATASCTLFAGNTQQVSIRHETIVPLPSKAGNTISGRAVLDLNGNGQPDLGEPPLAGVRVDLTDGSVFPNRLVASVVTGTDGKFSFPALPTRVYILRVTPAAGVFATNAIPGAEGQRQKRLDAYTIAVMMKSGLSVYPGSVFLVRPFP